MWEFHGRNFDTSVGDASLEKSTNYPLNYPDPAHGIPTLTRCVTRKQITRSSLSSSLEKTRRYSLLRADTRRIPSFVLRLLLLDSDTSEEHTYESYEV